MRHTYVRAWACISRPQGDIYGFLWAKTLHTPLREVGYVAFYCVQGRYCHIAVGGECGGGPGGAAEFGFQRISLPDLA